MKAETKLSSDGLLSVVVRAAWMHEFETERSTKGAFLAAPGYDFVIRGAQPAADSLRAGAGLNLSLNPRCSVVANFDCDFSGIGYRYSGTGGLRVSW